MKLYTYTMQRSLPRLALKGMPEGFWFSPDLPMVFEWMSMDDEDPKDPPVILSVESDGLEGYLGLEGERVEDVATMAREQAESEDAPDPDSAYDKIYQLAEQLDATPAGPAWLKGIIENFDGTNNMAVIPASKVSVLRVKSVEWPEGYDKEPVIEYASPPKPLTAFKQPLVTRLLRSIFLPRHKLYGKGPVSAARMGFLSKFFPRGGADVEDMPPPDVVSGVPLVWAAGKTFQRGMNGAFGAEVGGAIGKLVSLRLGAVPGKYLGSGAKGAAYMFGPGRVVKVTMDGSELQASAHLIGARHPNLAMVHDVFIVSDGQKGAGIIVRDAVDTTLDHYDKAAAKELDEVMDDVLAAATGRIGEDAVRIADVDPKVLAEQVEAMIELLRDEGCADDVTMLLDLADAFRALRHYGIIGIDFDSKNVGVVKKPSPRPVLFDYGMTQSPPIEVEVINLQNVEV